MQRQVWVLLVDANLCASRDGSLSMGAPAEASVQQGVPACLCPGDSLGLDAAFANNSSLFTWKLRIRFLFLE